MDSDLALRMEQVEKRYGPVRALDGLDLTVATGSVVGLLGPNGAGKTTAVRILATLTEPDAGRAWVTGLDVVREPHLVRRRIGLAGQHAAVDEKLSGRQNLLLFGRLHHLPERVVRQRAGELLDRFGLSAAADRVAGTYSGGMRRRLDVAVSLLVHPAVLFLDEPTTGLDPRSRAEVWQHVRELVTEGTTVLLTTQYLDEADQLADRVAVVNGGRVVTEGTPDELKSRLGQDTLDVVVRHAADLDRAATVVATVTTAPPAVDPQARRIRAGASGSDGALVAVVRELDRAGVAVEDVALRRPTLDDVFLRLTEAGRA